jgi:hypothetical protein
MCKVRIWILCVWFEDIVAFANLVVFYTFVRKNLVPWPLFLLLCCCNLIGIESSKSSIELRV